MELQQQTRRRDFDHLRFEQIVNTGIAAVKGGDFDQARQLLSSAVAMDPTDARPWLWLSATTNELAEQRNFLEYALAADPNNGAARRGLVLLSEKIRDQIVLAEGESIAPRSSQEPENAETERTFICQQCGGKMRFDLERRDLVCDFCGSVQATVETPSNGKTGQAVDFILPTRRGHRWAEAQHQLACERCGAISLLAAGETVHECPYCGSQRLFASEEKHELLDPEAIGLVQVDHAQAQRILQRWMGSGFFIPDDLRRMARTSALRPAYYPFWSLSGTLELQWTCEVNLGSNKAPRWVPQNGYEFENFDHILIPGIGFLQTKQLNEILPFLLDDVVEFKPEYLAGWTAMTYDQPLTTATLAARERVVRKVRQEIYNRVEVAREKRNLRTGATNWSGMTYKLLLLPLWVGTFHYKGETYRILVNGQTGKISGEKPVDRIKVWIALAIGVLGLVAVTLIVVFLALLLGLT
jgi:DNA-directed RNA polymerase subunit RPC12/RpoP